MLCTDYIGHASYLPPEVLAHKPFLPKPADIWSLGVCLFYIIFVSVPFTGFLQEDILEDQMTHSWKGCVDEKTSGKDQSIKEEVENLLESTMCLKPNDRSNICDLIRLWDEVSSESLYDT